MEHKKNDVVDVGCMPKKRSFKMFLDTNDTTSFSGKQFNASFDVDFSQVIRDPAGFSKSYMMTIQFLSRYDTTGTNGLSQNAVYKLHVDMGRGINAFQYKKVKIPSALVRVNSLVNGASLYTWFDAKPCDNEPMFIDNLRDITNITLNLIDASSNSTFNNTDDGTVNTATKYIAVLTFIEA
jgi:hypothetical protein